MRADSLLRQEQVVRTKLRRLLQQLMLRSFNSWRGEWEHSRHCQRVSCKALLQWQQAEVASCFRSLAQRSADARYRAQVLRGASVKWSLRLQSSSFGGWLDDVRLRKLCKAALMRP